MNYHDHARASGSMPPEFGMCAKCKKRTDVDLISIGGRLVQLCAKCQEELAPSEDEDSDPGKLPF